MCYTQGISIFWAVTMFSVAAYEHKIWKCWHYTLGLIYYGLMEVLQAIQHSYLAIPEDDYSMCQSRTNQSLTYLAGIHICYQPFFTSLLFQGLYRRNNLRERIESDMILRLCFLGGTWFMVAFMWASYTDQLAPPATPECPNYNWMRSGYDDRMNFTTPNLPGKACTYQSPSEQQHLAWVFPNYHTSYYQPATFLHAFLFFGPHLLSSKPIVVVLATICYLTGPVFQRWLTPDINEQPAIWCYGSVAQVCILVVVYRWYGVPNDNPPLSATPLTPAESNQTTLVYKGKLGEKPIIYQHINDCGEDDGDGGSKEKREETNKLLLPKDNSQTSDDEEEEETTTEDNNSV